jgi:hypothetical protein
MILTAEGAIARFFPLKKASLPPTPSLPGVLLAVMLAAEKAELSREIPAKSHPDRFRRNAGPPAVPLGLRHYAFVTLGP